MNEKFTAEEVQAAIRKLHMGDILLPVSSVISMLTAYADTLSKPADSGRVDDAMVDRAFRAMDTVFAGARPCLDRRLTEEDKSLALKGIRAALEAALAAQGRVDLLNGEMLQAGADALDRFVAWEPSNDEERYACIEAVWRAMRERAPTAALTAQGPGEKSRDFMVDDAGYFHFYAAPPASPAGVPDDLKPSPSNELLPEYRIGYSEGKYGQPEAWWPIWRDGYITNGAFPTKVHAILAAWQHAHRRLADGMEGVQRIVSRLAAPSAPEGDGGEG